MIFCRKCRKLANGQTSCGFCSSSDTLVVPQLDSYEQQSMVGEGGFGAVYQCKRADFTMWAVKVIDTQRAVQQGANQKHMWLSFERETEALSKLEHPHVVGFADKGAIEDFLFLIMEYVPQSLAQVHMRGCPMPLERALRVGLELASALAYVHDHSVSHRDIKPDNVGLDRAERVKLFDFGIAALRGPTWVNPHTGTFVGAGSLMYAPPEQFLEASTGPFSDVYAFGALLYELFAGHSHRRLELPQAWEPDSLSEFLNQPVADLPFEDTKIRPTALDELLFACLQPDPAKRPQTMKPVYAEIAQVAQHIQVDHWNMLSDFEKHTKWATQLDMICKEIEELQCRLEARQRELGEFKHARSITHDLGPSAVPPGREVQRHTERVVHHAPGIGLSTKVTEARDFQEATYAHVQRPSPSPTPPSDPGVTRLVGMQGTTDEGDCGKSPTRVGRLVSLFMLLGLAVASSFGVGYLIVVETEPTKSQAKTLAPRGGGVGTSTLMRGPRLLLPVRGAGAHVWARRLQLPHDESLSGYEIEGPLITQSVSPVGSNEGLRLDPGDVLIRCNGLPLKVPETLNECIEDSYTAGPVPPQDWPRVTLTFRRGLVSPPVVLHLEIFE